MNIVCCKRRAIRNAIHRTWPTCSFSEQSIKHFLCWLLTSATYLLAVDTKQRHLAAPWPPPAQCSCILTIIELLLGGGGAAAAAAAPHITDRVWLRLRLSTDLYRKCRRLAVCSPRSDTQPLLERIQCLQTTQFMQNYHYLQRWHYYLTRICFTLHFLLLDNSTGGGRPFALIRDGGIIFPINSSAPAGGSQTSLVVLSRST